MAALATAVAFADAPGGVKAGGRPVAPLPASRAVWRGGLLAQGCVPNLHHAVQAKIAGEERVVGRWAGQCYPDGCQRLGAIGAGFGATVEALHRVDGLSSELSDQLLFDGLRGFCCFDPMEAL